MVFQPSQLPGSVSGGIYVVAGVAAAIVVIATLPRRARGPNLDAIPTVGSNGWFGSWLAGFKNMINIADIIQEGYEKHKSAPFKVAEPYHWLVVLSSREQIEEIRRAPDDVLSLGNASDERLNTYSTLGREITHAPIRIPPVLSQLTRHLGTLHAEIRDETIIAFDEVLDLTDHEWKSVPVLDVMRQIVCRISNRVFVGLPLCRDPDWIDLNIQYTVDIFKAGALIGLFPTILRPLAAYFFTGAPRRGRARCLKLIGPMIEERLRCLHEYGNEWDRKPNDLISWMIDEADSQTLSVDALVVHLLLVNFTAVHSAAASFTDALFYLAANPQYVQPLREEVETIVEKEGWSKDALSKMRKVDSFLKECLRMKGVSAMSIARKAVKDFTFSDGTVIPKGALIGIATRSLHYDEKCYENPSVFEPFRFADMCEEDGTGATHQFASTTSEYLSFGYGRHACPGRFLVANELKTMLAHVVMTYDIKLEDGMTCPRSLCYGTAITPDPHARVLFRKRVY